MTGGRRAVQTRRSFAGFPMVLGVGGATSGHENGLDVAAAPDRVRQGGGRADQVRLPSGLEDRNVWQTVPDVVEFRVPEDPTDRFDLAVAFGVVPAITRDNSVEQPKMDGDRIGYVAVRRGGEENASTGGPLALDEFDHVTPIRQSRRVERDVSAYELLEAGAPPKNHERHGRHKPRPRPREDAERKMKCVAVDERAIQVHNERDGISHNLAGRRLS